MTGVKDEIRQADSELKRWEIVSSRIGRLYNEKKISRSSYYDTLDAIRAERQYWQDKLDQLKIQSGENGKG